MIRLVNLVIQRAVELRASDIHIEPFESRLKVRYRVDGYPIYTADRPDLWECFWNAGSVRPGKHKLTLEVLNTKGKLVARRTLAVTTRP